MYPLLIVNFFPLLRFGRYRNRECWTEWVFGLIQDGFSSGLYLWGCRSWWRLQILKAPYQKNLPLPHPPPLSVIFSFFSHFTFSIGSVVVLILLPVSCVKCSCKQPMALLLSEHHLFASLLLKVNDVHHAAGGARQGGGF